MRKNIKFALIGVLVLTMSSCNDWLDLKPQNERPAGEFWQSRTDVEGVLAEGYANMRGCLESILIWGDLRGNGLSIVPTKIEENRKNIRELKLVSTNDYTNWAAFYKVIASANSVIKYAPQVVEKDATFPTSVMRSTMSEAYFQRSLAYFYLARTFMMFPFVTEPYVDDNTPFFMVGTDNKVVMRAIREDLIQKALPYAKDYFVTLDPEDTNNWWRSKGRATKGAIHALIADISLWLEDYDMAIYHCQAVRNSGIYKLELVEDYISNIFYKGNSTEGIYEIQYSNSSTYKSTNNLVPWFSSSLTSTSKYKANQYLMSTYTKSLYTEEDKRGAYVSYLGDLIPTVWKYLGNKIVLNEDGSPQSTTERAPANWDQNFIIYRLPEVFLMEAEAYLMKASSASDSVNISKAVMCMDTLRVRAGRADLFRQQDWNSVFDTPDQRMKVLLDERLTELVGEGKSWYDLLRVASRNDYAQLPLMIELLTSISLVDDVTDVTVSNYRKSVLSNKNSHYFPIREQELEDNILLKQNPYYDITNTTNKK